MENHTNLIIDIGNTRIKTGWFEGNQLRNVSYYSSLDKLPSDKTPDRIMISNVSSISLDHLPDALKKCPAHYFDRSTSLPVKINYKTPETLGLDRIAGVVGASYEYPQENCLIIDMGSCINYDLITADNEFAGGIISPGFRMRLRSMHHFTGHLPDLSESWEEIELLKIGKSTRECMLKGAYDGILREIRSFVSDYKEEYGQLSVILTGGDASIFETRIKAPIFVHPNLVLIGLNRILQYNEA